MKKWIFIVTAAWVLALSSHVWAYTFNDITNVQEWNGTKPYGSGSWVDVIGTTNTYDTLGADLSGNILSIFTNWNPNKDGSDIPNVIKTADLFFDIGSNGTFDYAIRLDTTTGTGNVYADPAYNTSQDIFATLTGWVYGGQFDQTSPAAVPVLVRSTSLATGTTSVAWTIPTNGLGNQVAVDLTGLNLGSNWSFVWGTATCSNDAISGTERAAPVPEPSTLLLLGSGLAGLVGFGKRFRKS